MAFAAPQRAEHSLLKPGTASSCVLRTQGFYKKSRFVTHSSDRYQPAEFLNTSQAECEACSHSAPDLKPFLQERKGGKKKNLNSNVFYAD